MLWAGWRTVAFNWSPAATRGNHVQQRPSDSKVFLDRVLSCSSSSSRSFFSHPFTVIASPSNSVLVCFTHYSCLASNSSPLVDILLPSGEQSADMADAVGPSRPETATATNGSASSQNLKDSTFNSKVSCRSVSRNRFVSR